jgi:hypothetical protein
MNAARTLTAAAAILALCAVPPAQGVGQSPAGQAPPSKGVVIKGKAPVSKEILKVKLPRPQEADLPNGIHPMVNEDHRALRFRQMTIQGAGGSSILRHARTGDVHGVDDERGHARRTSQQIAQELRRWHRASR